MKHAVLGMGPWSILLLLLACGPGPDASSIKTLTIDPSLKGRVLLGQCSADQDCRSNEIGFYYKDNHIPFERAYRERGYLHWDGERIYWTEGADQVRIGTVKGDRVTALCSKEFEKVCDLKLSLAYPEEDSETREPVYLAEFELRDAQETSSQGSQHKNLLKYVIAAPNQENAGSCLYMANTGAMEILLNQAKEADGQVIDTAIDGGSDLSEAHLMNLVRNSSFNTDIRPILTYNHTGHSGILNQSFPFFNQGNGNNARENWGRDIPSTTGVSLPEVKLTPIFGGTSVSDDSKWDVAVMNDSHVEQVKAELRKDRPVVAVYNHLGIWHVVVLVGYDDNATAHCDFVNSFVRRSSIRASHRNRVAAALDQNGGCRSQGVFYVRDSLGLGERAAKYERRTYDWFQYLGNHAYAVSR